MPSRRSQVSLPVFLLVLLAGACSAPDPSTDSESHGAADTPGASTESTTPLVRLLADSQVLFGVFSGDRTAEQGTAMGRNRELDFVFYSLESGPFDISSGGRESPFVPPVTQPAAVLSEAKRRKRSAAARAFVACSSLNAMKGKPPGSPLG